MTENANNEKPSPVPTDKDNPPTDWRDLPTEDQRVIARNRLGSEATPKTLEMLESLGLD